MGSKVLVNSFTIGQECEVEIVTGEKVKARPHHISVALGLCAFIQCFISYFFFSLGHRFKHITFHAALHNVLFKAYCGLVWNDIGIMIMTLSCCFLDCCVERGQQAEDKSKGYWFSHRASGCRHNCAGEYRLEISLHLILRNNLIFSTDKLKLRLWII